MADAGGLSRGLSPSGWVVAAGSLAIAATAWLVSFRLPFPATGVSWGADADRMLAAASVGAAVAVAGMLRGKGARPLREAYVFAISVGGAIGVVAGLKTGGGIAGAVALAAVGAAVAAGAVRLADGRRRIANLGLFFVLYVLFLSETPAYMTAMTEIDGFGGAAMWLLGDVSRAHGLGAVAIAFASAALIGVAAWGPRGATSGVGVLLLGLSIGVAGPIAFVGLLVPALVRAASREGGDSQKIVLAALAGAASLMLADAVPRILIGGYAPPLNVTIAFVALPTFVWWNGRRLRQAREGATSRAFTAVGVIALLAYSASVVWVAWALTGFVRAAT